MNTTATKTSNPRLVVVSNRVADPRKSAAGGLAVALKDALQATGGLWFGWSGAFNDDPHGQPSKVHTQQAGSVTLATMDLSPENHDSYYLGYSNGVLWPVFHYRLDLAHFDAGHFDAYQRVNRQFARALMPLLKPDDLIWVHDYHLIPLAMELRALGCTNRIGFFLHVPLPPPLILAAIPHHRWLMQSLFSYDLAGFQSQSDLRNFSDYVKSELEAEQQVGGRWRLGDRVLASDAFPIGIDVDEFIALSRGSDAEDMYARMKTEYSRRRILLGVERLDYSKGLPQRIVALRHLLHRNPEHIRHATLVQIVAPSREAVDTYSDLLAQLESLCGAINGDFGELDWMPVRYIHRGVSRRRLPGLYRAAEVGLVTPLRDGMNLVAKEFVAAQDPDNPGVLILSRFAGAAEQMKDALLVNPYDTTGIADAIERALKMPLEERKERHQRLLAGLRKQDVHWWRRSFLGALQGEKIESAGNDATSVKAYASGRLLQSRALPKAHRRRIQ